MAPGALPDPVIGLIQWLKTDPEMIGFWPANFRADEPFVTYYPQTKEAVPVYESSPRVIGIKPAGIGAGTGQLAMARYESMRIDAVVSAHSDFAAYQLGKFMHDAILQVRGRCVECEYQGIDYDTRFVNIYQSGGPAPVPRFFADRQEPDLHSRSILYVYNVNYTTF